MGILNYAPVVDAGPDQTIVPLSNAVLSGAVTDDGLPNPPGTVSTVWSQVSGPGTVSFTNKFNLSTTARFSTNGVYVVRLTADDLDLSGSDDVTITVNSGAAGSLSGFSVTPTGPVDLTAEGDLDWAHWGLTTANDFNHKSGVSQQISNVTVIGGGGKNRVKANPIGFSWTDGTPAASTTDTHGGVWKNGVGSGFQIIVPADTSDRTLRVYVGLWAARGRFEATLSDGSAPAFIDTSLDNSTGTIVAAYTISYRAGSGGQSLIVKWTVQTAYNSYGNVTLEAATLDSMGGGPVNQAPVVDAGADQTITLPSDANLSGTVNDDGLPNPPATVTTTWSKVSGPGTVTFANAGSLSTTAAFSAAGIYVLRLTADDSDLTSSDDVTITVNSGGAANQAPGVNAGVDQAITLPSDANLSGTVNDDGLPNPPATVTTTWSKVSGPGTVTFANAGSVSTTAAFSTAGVYVLRLTADDSDLTSSDDVTITVNSGTAGSISGFSVTPAGPVDLTAEGDLDWAHWGLTTANDFNHKSGVSQQISNVTVIGSGGKNRVNANPIGFSWRDGTPVGSATDTHGGVWKNGTGSGFQIIVPADTSDRTLRIYVGLWAARGRFEATLSDGSAPAFIDTSLDNSTGTSVAVYTISYRAGSNGQSLIVKWTVQTAYNSYGNVTLEAATLDSMGGGAANQAPGVNAGVDQAITLPSDANLSGTVNDDGLPNPPATVTSTWSKVSGPGTVTFANAGSVSTTAAFSTAGVYVLRLTADDSDLTSSDDVTITVNSGAAGSISGFSVTPAGPVDLTAEGDLDWAHWGLTTANDFNHKSGVSQQISNVTVIGSGGKNRVNANPIGFSWRDGTPVGSATDTHGGVWKNGTGSGFQIIVPADTSDRTLRVYVGLWAARGRFEATLSDGSAPAFVDTSLDNSTATSVAVYSISYRAGSNGQSLIVKWTVQTAYNNYGNVTLEAAALTSP